jgi:hypothetical protein
MTPETLATVGQALYGPAWQTRLASALGVNDRTVRRWASGENEIPAYVRGELMALCRKRGVGIINAMRLMRLERDHA